ncbi:LuxR C-terminal-related transcriptional regulator [Cellulomonas sp. URHB0016]
MTMTMTTENPTVLTDDESTLTSRERIVLAELRQDVTLEEIARQLWVTRNTVKSQVRSIYRKIGVSTRAEAVAWARSHRF